MLSSAIDCVVTEISPIYPLKVPHVEYDTPDVEYSSLAPAVQRAMAVTR